MKNKVIINGIDVSECKHYTGNVDYLSNKDWTCRAEMINTRCEDCPNCDFKQLKRAEQKFKKIEEKCKEYSTSTDIYDESDILAGEILQIIEGKENE